MHIEYDLIDCFSLSRGVLDKDRALALSPSLACSLTVFINHLSRIQTCSPGELIGDASRWDMQS